MANVPRHPIYIKYWPQPWPQAEFYYRASSIQLLRSVFPPINQEIWPLPIQPPRIYAQSYSSPNVLTQVAAPTLIPPQYDYPLPPQIQTSTSIRTWIQQGIKEAPSVPFSQEDWPLPRQPYRVYAEARRADIALLHSVKPPIVQTEWPNPRVPFQPPSARTWIQQAIKEVARPSGQSDWPVPQRPTVIPARHFPFPNVIVQAATTKPFLQNIWPLPIRPPVPPSRHFRLENIVIAQALTKPFLQNDWPIPIPPIFPGWARQFGQGAWPTIGLIAPPVPRVSTEARFRSPLQDDDARPDVPDQRRPGISAIRRPSNESPSSARDRSWRYE